MVTKAQSKKSSRNSGKPIVSRSAVKLTGKCLLCGKKEVLTDTQVANAQISGAATSNCCYFPMTIVEASA
jgi:hypothetical protein